MVLPVVRQDEDIMSREKLAGLVRGRRKALGLTQPQVAERGDVSVELVRRVETNRSGDLRASKIEGLERALEWESGSIRAVLNGGTPTDVHRDPDELVAATTRTGDHASTTAPPSEAGDRFALAHHVLALRETLAAHQNTIGQGAREALAAEMARSARDAEESIIRMMPWLDDADRGKAIDLLIDLRKALHDNAAQ
jgi:transcriptional regulator with XRE-family HTH domain